MLQSMLEYLHQGHAAKRGWALSPNGASALRQRFYCDLKSVKQLDVQPKKQKKSVVQLSNYELLKICSVRFVVCQHSTDPARWGFRRHTAGRRRCASLAANLPYMKLVILLSFLPLATQRHFPFSLCCFLLYCNSALEGIPSLLPDLPLASFRTHQEENQTKKRWRTYEKEKIFFQLSGFSIKDSCWPAEGHTALQR